MRKILLGHYVIQHSKLGQKCQHCKTVKGPYTDPESPQGSLVANNPMDV